MKNIHFFTTVLVLASGIRKVGLLFSYTVSSNSDVSSVAQFGVQMFQSEYYSRTGLESILKTALLLAPCLHRKLPRACDAVMGIGSE